jgi:pimeloyl-ACP methyl ester carboxylesterase
MATERVQLDGERMLCVERFGRVDGKPVLYFHGLPGSRLDVFLADALFRDAGLAVLALDRPGFGGSSFVRRRALLDWPRDVGALADRLGLERFAVVGYSSGGKYAIACAASLPERVTWAGVLAGTGPPEIPGFRAGLGSFDRISMTLVTRARPLALALWGLMRRMALGRPDRFLAQLEKETRGPDRAVLADPAMREALLRTVREGLRPGAAGVVEDYAVEARPWGFALGEIRVPMRIWHGDSDDVVPLEHSRYLAARIPTASLTVMERAGHLLLGEQLEPVVRELASADAS